VVLVEEIDQGPVLTFNKPNLQFFQEPADGKPEIIPQLPTLRPLGAEEKNEKPPGEEQLLAWGPS